MPGTVLYDFGDMVRSCATTASEDHTETDSVGIRIDIFTALLNGYLDSAKDFIEASETEQLAFSAKLITLTVGMRFLTDYLQGDPYFKIKHPEHNLHRARNQFALASSIHANLPQMEDIVGGAK